jgi:hypothetical protein
MVVTLIVDHAQLRWRLSIFPNETKLDFGQGAETRWEESSGSVPGTCCVPIFDPG